MKLTVRAVTRNWLRSGLKKTVSCKVEFRVDTDAESMSEKTKARIGWFEQDLSLKLFAETLESGKDSVWAGSFGWMVDDMLLRGWGAPSVSDLFFDNADVQYVEYEWNGWTFIGRGYGMSAEFGAKPYSRVHPATRRKVERDAARFETGKTVLEGSVGKPILYGEYASRYDMDGNLRPGKEAIPS